MAEGRVCGRGAEACLEKVILSKRGYTGREAMTCNSQKPEARLGLVTIHVLKCNTSVNDKLCKSLPFVTHTESLGTALTLPLCAVNYRMLRHIQLVLFALKVLLTLGM